MTIDELVAAYAAAWQEHDEDARRELLSRSWAVDGVYIDPTARVEGREALVAHLAGFQQRYSEHRMQLSTASTSTTGGCGSAGGP